MKERLKSWCKRFWPAVLVLLLALSLLGNYRSLRALHVVVGDELNGLSAACDRVRARSSRTEGAEDYDELVRDFSVAAYANLRALDHIAFYAPAYEVYDLTNLETFTLYLSSEEDEGQQQKNIETICKVGEELDGIVDNSQKWGRYAYPKQVKDKLKTVEQICADWLMEYDERNPA